MALGYLYIYFWKFLTIYENWFYASISGIRASETWICLFFQIFWGYKLHFQPINLRKFNLQKNYNNFKNPNHRQVDLTLAHKMNIRFTKISQSPSRPSVRAWNTIIPIFYMYFSEFSKIHQRQTIWNFGNFLLSPWRGQWILFTKKSTMS